jgi:D-inositol-3-phosphate glycosyltransferase
MELCRRWDVPHVTTFHTTAKVKMDARPGESESALRVNSETDVMESADAIVVSTQQEKSDLSRLYGVFADKIRVVPAGVDLGLFQPMSQPEARRTLGITEDRVVLAVGARIQPLKGFDLLIEAIGRVKDAADTRLLIVGGRPELDAERDKLRSLAAREGLDGTVSLVGPVSQDKLPTYYGAADVFVLPSYYETFGMSALEAMACGVPVISSAAGGVKSYLQDGETGYLVPWQSAESYAHALDGLLADAALRHRMSLAARAKAETMDWGKVVSRLLAIYAGLEERALTSVAGA